MSSPHESPGDGGVSVAPEAPYLSVVVAARNDDHGGNLSGRMQVFADAWINQAKRHTLSSELIVVAWNPPAGRDRLAQALRRPGDTGPCEVRFIEVSREVHDRLPNSATIPLHQLRVFGLKWEVLPKRSRTASRCARTELSVRTILPPALPETAVQAEA